MGCKILVGKQTYLSDITFWKGERKLFLDCICVICCFTLHQQNFNPNPFVSQSMLPKVVKRRVHALKRLQVQCANLEAKFYEEVHELERKYAALYHPLFDKVKFLAFFQVNCLLVWLRPEASFSSGPFVLFATVEYSRLCLWLPSG